MHGRQRARQFREEKWRHTKPRRARPCARRRSEPHRPLCVAIAPAAWADDPAPIKIGVIAEAQAVAGSSIPQAAQIAADEINAKGGVDGRKIEFVSYDDHSSSAEAVRAFQRMVSEDHVNAVIGSTSARSCWRSNRGPARLKTVSSHLGLRLTSSPKTSPRTMSTT